MCWSVPGKVPEVPLADADSRVVFGFEGFGQRRDRQRQILGSVDGHAELLIGSPMARDEVRDADVSGILTREYAGARRRADRASRIGVGEAYALARQGVDVGRLDLLLAVTTEMAVAQIVGHDEDNIRSLRSRGRTRKGRPIEHADQGRKERDESGHFIPPRQIS